jgi:hypothetical protein
VRYGQEGRRQPQHGHQGKHLDGFIDLLADVLADCGLPAAAIHSQATTLPGWFRPSKNWDLVVVDRGDLLASMEFKAHVGPSFGNNFRAGGIHDFCN